MNHTNSETMANREELGIIRGARAGDAVCQLALGKLYLFGGASLPLSLPTALHWLNRAALQDQDEAWMLIGSYVPFEHAQHCLPAVLSWYDRAYDAGVQQAGVVLAQLVLNQSPQHDATQATLDQLRDKALHALDTAARSGSVEAQWLLAQQCGTAAAGALPSQPPSPPAQPSVQAGRGARPPASRASVANGAGRQQWLARAADNGMAAAQYAMLDQVWEDERDVFLQRAMPLVRKLLADAPCDAEAARLAEWPLGPQQLTLLSRCASLADRAPAHGTPEDETFEAYETELRHCRELAAHGGDRHAQLALGLWFARMDSGGKRQSKGIAAVNFKRAIRWLSQAGEQGLADAWFALSRIYLKPEFSQRCVAEAQCYLERAAEMGHCGAQLECGMYAWRNRRNDEHSDVRAVYWLQKAAAQGCDEAEAALGRIAQTPKESGWTESLAGSVTRELSASQPLLAARLELAELFGLSRAEALLLDVKAADHGHCLVVDIRASYGRSKRRLILLRTARERQALDRISRQFDAIDGGPDGPEGNYRQRLYRLKTWLPAAGGDDLMAA
jgi:TPR repeat protein